MEEINEGESSGQHEDQPYRSRRPGIKQRREMAHSQPLIALLMARRAERGLRMADLAAQFGIKQPYLSQLLCGDKPFAGASMDCLRAIARFLNIPPIRVFILASLIDRSDLCLSDDEMYAQREGIIRFLSDSPFGQEANVSLETLKRLPGAVQDLLLLMHQAVTSSEYQQRWSRFASSPDVSIHRHKTE